MNTNIEIKFCGQYLHVIYEPNKIITPESTKMEWEMIINDCKVHDCSRILLEGTVKARRMGTKDAYFSGSQVGNIPNLRLALLYYGYVADATSDFFRMVIASKGGAARFFNEREEAIEWLCSETDNL